MQKKSNIVLTILGIIFCLILIPILVVNVTLIVKSYTDKAHVPSFLGVSPMIVLTDSMYPEIESGDLIICKQEDPEEVKVGDIICFFDPAGNGTSTVTHRVETITEDENGGLAWTTKGDANNAADDAVVPAGKLVGVYFTKIHGLGNVVMFMQSTKGLIICVLVPVILLVLFDVIRNRLYEKKKEDETEALMAELNALRAEKQKDE